MIRGYRTFRKATRHSHARSVSKWLLEFSISSQWSYCCKEPGAVKMSNVMYRPICIEVAHFELGLNVRMSEFLRRKASKYAFSSLESRRQHEILCNVQRWQLLQPGVLQQRQLSVPWMISQFGRYTPFRA